MLDSILFMLNITSKLKLSTYMILLILLLTLVSFTGVLFLKNNLLVSNKLKQEIILNTIQRDTSNILTIVLYKYEKQKDILKQKHKEVFTYLSAKNNPLGVDLKEIYEKINNKDKRYNIYITDDNLTIKNTTFKNDLGFKLSFAKKIFKQHKKEKVIGVSAPILEASSNKFFSYSDSYLNAPNNKKVLQISYTYEGFGNILKQLNNNIKEYKSIKDIKAYLYLDEHKFTADFYFKKYKSIKPSLEELQNRIKQGNELSKLSTNHPIKKVIKKDGKIFNEIYIIQESPIFEDAKIIYSILFDKNEHINMIQKYNILLYVIFVVFIIALIVIVSIKRTEDKLEFQDKFVQQSLHEIKTPLSIILLNNELRNLKYGDDDYSLKINNSIQNLKNSYEDMTFMINMELQIPYPIKELSLNEIINQRVKIFTPLFKAQKKDIDLKTNSGYIVNISFMELERLMDNNLSNALKYSYINTTTKISLEDNILTFTTASNKIVNVSKIFKKYYREDTIKGGHGIGLNIVQDIINKYNIKVEVSSNDDYTTFKYVL
ncbi:MAG: HAMP domain-containing sensor histidine kinase [Campylobacterota bacterium]|nr:HAMP domain-containing sensor histidine kinase [Campylobacterota bacterium]